MPSEPLNTLLYLYRSECDFGEDLACNDDSDDYVAAEFEAFNLQPGAYYVVLDTLNAQTIGPYTLEVSAKLASGELCDPAQPFLGCERSYCDPRMTPPRCTAPLDCAGDMIDVDGDQMTDEDACNERPMVTCSANINVGVGGTVLLTGTATADNGGTIIGSGWEVVSTPFDGIPVKLASNTRTATLSVDLVGRYVLRYSAADDQLQAVACETTVNANSQAPLRVEMIFDSALGSEFLDVDLHVLSPDATAWFEDPLDCSEVGGCGFDGSSFAYSSGAGSPGVEAIELTSPLRNGRSYELGALYYDWDAMLMANVRVFVHCDGQVHEMFGPKTLINGDPADMITNDFWKVAQVTMAAPTGCTALVRDQIVTQEEAAQGR